jgi:hypothetical protein
MIMNAISVTQEQLILIAAYNKAHNADTWVIQTPPDSTIGGFSARFVDFLLGSERVIIRIANDDLMTVPLSQITISVKF